MVFSQDPLLVLDYSWSWNSPIYWRAVTPNKYRTHTFLKFCFQSTRLQVHVPLHPTKHLLWKRLLPSNILSKKEITCPCKLVVKWSDSNGNRTHNHLVRIRTFNHLAKLAYWLSRVVSTYPVRCIWLCYLHVTYAFQSESTRWHIVAWMSRNSLL